MAIVGLGTDIVEITRIDKIVQKSGSKLAERILTPAEFQIYQSHKQPIRYLAKRFATKEAAAKALGLGMRNGLAFNQFETLNDINGKPILSFLSLALLEAQRLGVRNIHLSITDEQHYAMAVIILES